MNTIEKLMCEVQLLDGLEMHILENSYRNKCCIAYTTTHDEDLEDNFEFDRVFNNVDIIEGMDVSIMEKPHKNKRCRTHTTTHDEDLEDNFEFDRVFNNVDVIESMDVSVMEKPHKNRSIRTTIKSLVPTTEYDNKIVVLENYEEKIKG